MQNCVASVTIYIHKSDLLSLNFSVFCQYLPTIHSSHTYRTNDERKKLNMVAKMSPFIIVHYLKSSAVPIGILDCKNLKTAEFLQRNSDSVILFHFELS